LPFFPSGSNVTTSIPQQQRYPPTSTPQQQRYPPTSTPQQQRYPPTSTPQQQRYPPTSTPQQQFYPPTSMPQQQFYSPTSTSRSNDTHRSAERSASISIDSRPRTFQCIGCKTVNTINETGYNVCSTCRCPARF
jgi:hypothetical protein